MKFPSIPFDEKKYQVGHYEFRPDTFIAWVDDFKKKYPKPEQLRKFLEKQIPNAEAGSGDSLGQRLNYLLQEGYIADEHAEFISKQLQIAMHKGDDYLRAGVIKFIAQAEQLKAQDIAYEKSLAQTDKHKK
ncbi:MAG: hypothetical protein NTZ49_03700 [Candidatus Parcubacteria bacterium]|nr:hypothetical protein [Candidatus Parcubacteria bacterium]